MLEASKAGVQQAGQDGEQNNQEGEERGRGRQTQTEEGEKEEPEEAEDGGGQGLVHGGEVDPLLQFSREVSEVEVMPVHHVLKQDVDEAKGTIMGQVML